MKKLLLAVSLLAVMPMAWAAQYTQIVPQDSAVHFHYQQMGVDMDGQFKELKGELVFDPAQAEQGKAAFEVPLSSVDAGSDDADTELAGTDWFDTNTHPVARFESQSIQAQSDGSFKVHGMLTIKGKSKEVTVPAQFFEQDGVGVFEGKFTILRGDFGIGEGAWSAFDIVANEVQVEFRIVATP